MIDLDRSLGSLVAIAALLLPASQLQSQTPACNAAFQDERTLTRWFVTSSRPLVAECKDCGPELIIIADASIEQGAQRARKPFGHESKEMVDELMGSARARENAINRLRTALQRQNPECSFRFEDDGRRVVNNVHFLAAKYFRECPATATPHQVTSEWLALDSGCVFKITIAARYSGPYRPEPLSAEAQAQIQVVLQQIRWR